MNDDISVDIGVDIGVIAQSLEQFHVWSSSFEGPKWTGRYGVLDASTRVYFRYIPADRGSFLGLRLSGLIRLDGWQRAWDAETYAELETRMDR